MTDLDPPPPVPVRWGVTYAGRTYVVTAKLAIDAYRRACRYIAWRKHSSPSYSQVEIERCP